jgi:hypothetical protein
MCEGHDMETLQFLNKSEFARRLGCAPATLSRWLIQSQLPPDALLGRPDGFFDALYLKSRVDEFRQMFRNQPEPLSTTIA